MHGQQVSRDAYYTASAPLADGVTQITPFFAHASVYRTPMSAAMLVCDSLFRISDVYMKATKI
jgi:hypothetical protein